MNYPYQLQSFEAYLAAYQKSIQDPEGFWAEVAENFTWQKNGTAFWSGISKIQK